MRAGGGPRRNWMIPLNPRRARAARDSGSARAASSEEPRAPPRKAGGHGAPFAAQPAPAANRPVRGRRPHRRPRRLLPAPPPSAGGAGHARGHGRIPGRARARRRRTRSRRRRSTSRSRRRVPTPEPSMKTLDEDSRTAAEGTPVGDDPGREPQGTSIGKSGGEPEPVAGARAKSIKNDRLVDRGVDGARIETAGMGQDLPSASNDTAEGRARTAAARSSLPAGSGSIRTGKSAGDLHKANQSPADGPEPSRGPRS